METFMETAVIWTVSVLIVFGWYCIDAIGGFKIFTRKYNFSRASQICNISSVVISVLVILACIPAYEGLWGETAHTISLVVLGLGFGGAVIIAISDILFKKFYGASLTNLAKKGYELAKTINEGKQYEEEIRFMEEA